MTTSAPPPSLLVANRGEIAVRVVRAASSLGLRTVAVYAADEPDAAHVRLADEAYPLNGSGPAAYLDIAAVVAIAVRAGCGLVHPGYGFLSENADLAAACEAAGVTFVGPPPGVLRLFADKTRARALAVEARVPVLPATDGATSPEEARAFADGLGAGTPVMVKAVAGGGGRGMREVRDHADLPEALVRCASEALRGFGDGAVYVERLLPRAKHIEVQVLADRTGAVAHLYERECTVQRRHQKVVEFAPSPWLPDPVRARLLGDAVRMAGRAGHIGLGTFEFLVDVDTTDHYFIECNPRLQVEHTVTEEITGLDLVAAQIRVAQGATLADLDLAQDQVPPPRGYAVQARVNAEDVRADGVPRPSTGVVRRFGPVTGPGVRIDTHAYDGMPLTGAYDPLLAKVIGHVPDGSFADAADLTRRALDDLDIDGPPTNRVLLRDVLTAPEFLAGDFDTTFLAGRVPDPAPGAAVDEGPVREVRAPLSGTVVTVAATPGRAVRAGETLVVLEAMKMEHVLAAPVAGTVTEVRAVPGVTLDEGDVTVVLEASGAGPDTAADGDLVDPDLIRPDLAQVRARRAAGLDENRPEKVARRHGTGHRTARENVDDLCDGDSFTEYGALAIAAQRRRRTVEDLVANTPHDGMVCGVGTVNAADFPGERARVAVLAYDYTVLAGTQGMINHKKTDRVLDLAADRRLPVVLFAEGGGGRPGDTDNMAKASGLDTRTFATMGRLSGTVPSVGIVTGRCFAGNAALLGCCDVIISTEDANIGMGGPAMIEGGGLGVFRPEDIGPASVQAPNGVVDVLVADEAEAVAVAKKYLSYFQGPVAHWDQSDQRGLRHVVPENRVRAYDVRTAIDLMADTGSVLELRRDFGVGVITALVRVEGRPMGLVANNPWHLGGAIDADAADKMARFLQLCDAHGLPVVSLCDTPGFMVGPESETTATVRHFSRLFVIGANMSVPLCLVVLRKGYGLGAQAMAGGSFKEPVATVSWPTGEIGPMGLEGAVRLGFRRELAEIEDEAERQRMFDKLLAEYYENGKALHAASLFELDDVIDPADTRRWLAAALADRPAPEHRPVRPFIDTW
ncbi:MAG TPA: carboxyl transferase domain-containing protein [Streptosporangiaceae bacterium]|jgi:acetyl/propionyl-CoA carboxylase alpha subunit/acetyl-CoA carboxylase carboxyltransferase component